ncbi:MAG: GGDEF domain-containing protein [Clostridia bacterium]|nr:GGDEF domain-containing protein [Clostridia bacterium]
MTASADALWRAAIAAGPEGAAEAVVRALVDGGLSARAALYAWDGRLWRLRAAAGPAAGEVPATLVHSAPRAPGRAPSGAGEVRRASAWGGHVALRLWGADDDEREDAAPPDGQAARSAFEAELDRVLALLACAEACRAAGREVDGEVDRLTGLLSSLGARRRLDLEVSRARRLRQPVALVHLAVRSPGSAAGLRERLECEVARIARAVIRDTDVACREGPEEFLVILPGSDASGAERVTSRWARRIRDFARKELPGLEVVVTAGIGDLPADASDAAGLLAAAHRALYLAELAGGNCVRLARAEAEGT